VIPNLRWVFVALVVEPQRATLYKGLDGILRAEVNPVSHGPEEFDGTLLIGQDAAGAARHFRGWIDEVRIFDAALSTDEIAEIHRHSLCGPGGTVHAGTGEVVDVLHVNGEPHRAAVAAGAPVEISLDAAPAGPVSPLYALWVWTGAGSGAYPVESGTSLLGCTVLPSPLHEGENPQPFRCLRSPGMPRIVCGSVRERPGPARAPFLLRVNHGLPSPGSFTFQALIQDAGAGNPFAYAITNAVELVVEP